jgi:outer membrane protein TolC
MKPGFRRALALAVLAFTAFINAPAQQRYELTVKEAVELAFKNVIELKNLQLDYQSQEAKNKEITGAAYPQLSGTASMSKYFQLPLILFPDGSESAIYGVLRQEGVKDGSGNAITKSPLPVLRQISFQQPWNASVGATLSQLLFQPDVFVGLQARKTALEYANMNIEVAKERIKDSAYQRYYAILIAEKQLAFIKDGIKRLEKLVSDNTVMYKNGFAEKLDIDKGQVQLNNLQSSKAVLENSINIAYAAMKYVLGLSQQDTIVLKDSLSVDAIKAGILDDAFRYEDRKEIQLLGKVRRLQELDVKRYKLGYIPTVSAFVNYNVNGQSDKFVLTDRNAFWLRAGVVGLNINMPIFDGFQRKYKIQQSQISLKKTENTITAFKQVIDLDQRIAKEGLKNALVSLDIQQRNIELAQSVYNTTKKKFEQGLGSSFEVLLAESELQGAQSNYFTALYNAIVSKINYQRALGKLD